MPTADTPSLSAAEARALLADLATTSTLILAVSGGPDSTALLLIAARWRASLKRGPKLIAVTVDHQLRPESAKEAAQVKRLAQRLGVPHRIVRWRGRKPKSGLQAAARAVRYRLLADAARRVRAEHILTAHTLDDQAETVLLRLAHGSGLAGLSCMARMTPLDGLQLVRPLLDIPKARLIATLRAANVPDLQDPSNHDPRFTRARLRKLMPVLASEGLDALRLARFARRMARAETALQLMALAAHRALVSRISSRSLAIDGAGFAALPAEIALRLLGEVVAATGDEGPVELGKLEALLGALSDWFAAASRRNAHPPRRLRRTLAGAMVTLDAHRLLIERAPPRRGAFTKAR